MPAEIESSPEGGDLFFMLRALALAEEAARLGEVPVGAVVVKDGAVIGEGFNTRERDRNPLRHAELVAIAAACARLQAWRLMDCTLYVTLEPCAMCAGALVNARLSRLVYGARDPKAGAVHTLYQIPTDARLNHRLTVHDGVFAERCGQVLSEFFAKLRS